MESQQDGDMKVKILLEFGYLPALFGLGLSHGLTSDMDFYQFYSRSENIEKLQSIALKLAHKDGGHNKFLESICVWMDIDAPRFWWSEMDTYRVGISKQSESTMHTITKRILTQDDFEYPVYGLFFNLVAGAISDKLPIDEIKNILPEGFLQRRIVCTNYKTIQNIVKQRTEHRLPQWKTFIDEMRNLEHPEYIFEEI